MSRRDTRSVKEAERQIDAACAELIEDTEAFLSGRMAEVLEARGDLIPAWAWINLLAHGDGLQLWAERQPDIERAANRQWREARGYMAMEILELANLCGSLEVLQVTVLQPLEATAMSRPHDEIWTTREWFGWVGTALCEFRAMLYRPGGPMVTRDERDEEAA